MSTVISNRRLARAHWLTDRWFRALGLLALALLLVTAGSLALEVGDWRLPFALAHLAALLALVPLGAVLVARAYIEERSPAGVLRRYPLETALVLLACVTAAISLANFADGERWVRTTANLATVAIVLVLVARYLRTGRR